MKKKSTLPPQDTALFRRIRAIWVGAQQHASRSVNSSHVCANWFVGQQLVEAEQNGEARAAYGSALLETLSRDLSAIFGDGFSQASLRYMRLFYSMYQSLIPIHHPLGDESEPEQAFTPLPNALESGSAAPEPFTLARTDELAVTDSGKESDKAVSKRSILPDERAVQLALERVRTHVAKHGWKPGLLHPGLSWRHYRALIKVSHREARDFYEIEALRSGWTGRALERQVNSLLFERLLKSRDKEGILKLAREGNIVGQPTDMLKDPFVLEFLDMPESHTLVESKVEAAILSHLRVFLLELGTGFAFVGRQVRLTLEGDHFYPDLVFYHIPLKCYVIIDLKTRKLSHGDLGQMLLYVNYYDREIIGPGDNPTLGLILCTEKNDSVVRYVLDERNQQIFASRYQMMLPSEETLCLELKRELERLIDNEGET